jgi:cell division protein FtsB
MMRRMPSGQGPARSGGRPLTGSGPATASGRARTRRVAERADGRGGIRRAAGPARRTRAPRRPRRISGRAAVLGALLIALAFAYAYPVRLYLEQQAQINALRAAQAQQRGRIQGLNDSLAKWNDDEFVIAQARTRFQLVKKGELLYVVVDPAANPSDTQNTESPWFTQLWSNLSTLDQPSP